MLRQDIEYLQYYSTNFQIVTIVFLQYGCIHPGPDNNFRKERLTTTRRAAL
jgi:hypothetical protein